MDYSISGDVLLNDLTGGILSFENGDEEVTDLTLSNSSTDTKTYQFKVKLSEESTEDLVVDYLITGGQEGVEYLDHTNRQVNFAAGITEALYLH